MFTLISGNVGLAVCTFFIHVHLYNEINTHCRCTWSFNYDCRQPSSSTK